MQVVISNAFPLISILHSYWSNLKKLIGTLFTSTLGFYVSISRSGHTCIFLDSRRIKKYSKLPITRTSKGPMKWFEISNLSCWVPRFHGKSHFYGCKREPREVVFSLWRSNITNLPM